MAEIRETCSLVGKLNDVSIGDIVLLEDLDSLPTKISGYVVKLTDETVTLSHESPFNTRDLAFCRMRSNGFFGSQMAGSRGDRIYELDSFSKYKILNKHDPSDYLKFPSGLKEEVGRLKEELYIEEEEEEKKFF